MKRFSPIILILIGILVIYWSGIYQYISFDTLKAQHTALKAFITEHPISTPLIFMLSYTVLTALSVPGGIFLSLLGGYLFPQPLSTLYVVIAATVGATLLFLAAKTAIGDLLKKKAGPFLKKMEQGFQHNAASYLLFLRFVPLFPFWIVNLASALFGVPLRTFVWTTFVGIIPGALVFTLVGGGLEKVFEGQKEFSLSAIFNPELKIALVLLGLLALVPILFKKRKRDL